MSWLENIWDLIGRLKRGFTVGYSWDLPAGYTKKQEDVIMPDNAKYATPKDFLAALKPAAAAIEAKYGIPWMFAGTQAAHESRYGNSKLAIEAFNLFGVTGDDVLKAAGIPETMSMEAVKAHVAEHPEIPVIIMKTNEESTYPPEKVHYWTRPGDIVSKANHGTGSDVLVERPFHKYASYEESLTDWATRIMKRYPDAYAAATRANFEQFAEALQKGGYATDSKYAMQLVQLHTELEGIA